MVELVEGGTTRFVGIYHSTDPGVAGRPAPHNVMATAVRLWDAAGDLPAVSAQWPFGDLAAGGDGTPITSAGVRYPAGRTDGSDAPLPLAPGKTWIELLPAEGDLRLVPAVEEAS